MESMKNCEKCGRIFSSKTQVCPWCRDLARAFCTKCGASLPSGCRACSRCGAPRFSAESTAIDSAPASELIGKDLEERKRRRDEAWAKLGGGKGLAKVIGTLLGFSMALAACISCLHSTESEPPYYQPGPPADLITMLTRGDPTKQHCLGVAGLTTELVVAKEQLCKIIVNDRYNIESVKEFGYHGWQYGPKSDDGLEESEADLLLTEIGTHLQHADGSSLTRCEEIELAYDSARFLTRDGSSDEDPVLNCLSFFPGLASK